MSELSKKYSKIIKEVEDYINDENQCQFVKNKISEVSLIFMDIIDRMTDTIDDKIKDIELSQKETAERISKIELTINEFEKDLCDDYSDIEIICPYCNHEFYSDFDDSENNEIECPKCHNILELDLSSDIDEDTFISEGICNHGCSKCNNCDNKCSEDEDNDQEM